MGTYGVDMIPIILAVLTFLPFNAPEVVWPELSLEAQMAFIDVVRPDPIVQYVSTGRAAAKPSSRPLPPVQVEALIRTYFQPADVEWALRVSFCESGWDASAKNPTSSASGLFQHLARFWDDRSARAGWAGASIWDAEANTAVAAWLFVTGGPSHWVCK